MTPVVFFTLIQTGTWGQGMIECGRKFLRIAESTEERREQQNYLRRARTNTVIKTYPPPKSQPSRTDTRTDHTTRTPITNNRQPTHDKPHTHPKHTPDRQTPRTYTDRRPHVHTEKKKISKNNALKATKFFDRYDRYTLSAALTSSTDTTQNTLTHTQNQSTTIVCTNSVQIVFLTAPPMAARAKF